MSGDPLKVAIAGLGTVGAGVVDILQKQAGLLAARAGRPIELVAVSARRRDANRPVDVSSYRWFDDAAEMAVADGIDVIVELIGGSEGTARKTAMAALGAGRHLVTANKALLAIHGSEIAATAEKAGLAVAYEAAVAGGIPVIKGLREGLSANNIVAIEGILNGTCNYILTQMRLTGRDFEHVLGDAQALGYAEADPSFDVDGIDAAHKLTVLASAAFGCPVDFDSVHVEGIRDITALDIEFAAELGYRIKLLGIARLVEGAIERRVHPCMIPLDHPLAMVEDAFNAVTVLGDAVDKVTFIGRGAGAGPTASAVVADLVDVARGRTTPTFTLPQAELRNLPVVPMDRHRGEYYVRLTVLDQPGVIAHIGAAMRDEAVSISRLSQHGRGTAANRNVSVVFTTHETDEAAMNRVLARIEAHPAVVAKPSVIRIEAI